MAFVGIRQDKLYFDDRMPILYEKPPETRFAVIGKIVAAMAN